MTWRKKAVIAFAAATALLVSTDGVRAQGQEFSRYQAILDRAPFAPLAGGLGDVAQPHFAARYAFVGIVDAVGDNRLLAIVQDRESNRVHFLGQGDSVERENLKVVRLEQSPPRIVLQRGLEVATLAYQPRGSVAASPMQMGAGAPEQPTPASPVPRRIPFRRELKGQ